MTRILDEILVTKRDEVTVLRRPDTRDLLRRTALDAPPARGFAAALRAGPAALKVIAEIKRRSPSKGDLAPDIEPDAIARAYAAGGAAALSVLTDGPYFGGSMADLQEARGATNIPALRKDFVIDEVQVYEARAVGADAILLIVAALPDDALLRDLHELALGLGLDALVEVHDEAELERAAGIGAQVVGVNSRSLQTFGEDLGVAQTLRAAIPADAVAVAESAIRSVDDAQRMADAGFDAVLVGEALVRATDPTALCAAMSSCTRRRD
jgi:indole-3-glycerol phosphate synthase